MLSVLDLQNINILVIGDIMLDHYIYGDCNRISPEAPVQVVEVQRELYTLGGAGNVLKNLNALNVKADIIAVVGGDADAQIITNKLTEINVGINGIVEDNNRCTTIKSRVLVAHHQLIRLDREVTKVISDEKADQITSFVRENIHKYSIVLLSDYNKGLLSVGLLKQIFEICHQAGVKTVVDPKGADFSKYKGVNLIKPNRKEAIIASGISINTKDTLLEACKKIKSITGCDEVIVTMSEDGIALYENGDISIVPTKALDVVDVTGAGDTVLASLGVALASGCSLREACDFANHAAAVVISKIGSATATLDEIKKKFEE